MINLIYHYDIHYINTNSYNVQKGQSNGHWKNSLMKIYNYELGEHNSYYILDIRKVRRILEAHKDIRGVYLP